MGRFFGSIRSTRAVGRTLVVMLTLVGASCEAPTPFVLEEGVSESLAQHRKATLHELEYRYELTVPRAIDEPLTGTMAASFRWSDDDAAPVVVDFKDPAERVRAVRVDGETVVWTPEYDHIVIDAAEFTQGQTHTVEIEFAAGDEALNRNPEFLYTLFVPDRAHFSLPLFDQPDLKAPYEGTLHVPEDWVAVANGPTVAEEAGPEGLRTYTFGRTQPIPTYLLAFAAGDFSVEEAERDGRTFRMFHRETDAEKVARNAPTVFDLHASALAWLEDYTAIDYPYAKFDFVLIPPFQYGGMEHPGAITYRQSSLFLDATATQGQILGRASLIAHETAHQWFGDLVTMAWFDDVWTKEVFANFMAAKIVHPAFPELDHDLRFFLAHHNTAYGVDRTPGANPIRQPLENLRMAGTLYGAIIYQKAPIVMRQLELLVGEEAFREGMRTYLSRFAHGNATWPDLIAILDELSDEDLAGWSRVWVEEPGRPTLEVEVTTEGERLVTIDVVTRDPADRGRVWPQTMEFALGYPDRIEKVGARLSGDGVAFDSALPEEAPDWVLPNAGGFEYGHMHLDATSLEALLTDLPTIEDPRVRGIAWVTLQDAVLEGEVDPERWYDLLLRGAAGEPVEQNLQRVLGFLGGAHWNLLTDNVRAARVAETESVLWNGLLAADRATVRSSYFSAWRGIVMTDDGVERLRRLWTEEERVPGLDLSENDFTALATALAVRGAPDSDQILVTQEERISNPDRRARWEFLSDALSIDPADREAFFERMRDEANRGREPWVLSGLGYLHHPLRREHGAQFVIPALELVEEIQRTGDIFFPGRWLGASLGGHRDPELATAVRAWIDALPGEYPHRLRGKILQSADGLFRSARIVHGWDG